MDFRKGNPQSQTFEFISHGIDTLSPEDPIYFKPEKVILPSIRQGSLTRIDYIPTKLIVH